MENVELDEVQWRSPEWVQAYGLRTDNVMEYFALSPFYDRSSNNQVLKMQTNFNEQLRNRALDTSAELKKMKGVEYQVVLAREPDLWVIRKQERHSPTDVQTLAVYFVSGENVYQSPSVYNVLVARILATSKHLEEALRVAEKLPEFTFSGYEYKRRNKSETAASQNPKSIQTEAQARERSVIADRALNISLQQLQAKQAQKTAPQQELS